MKFKMFNEETFSEFQGEFQNQRILVAEDSEDLQWLLKEILERFGIVVGLADNGREALQMLEKENYNYLFMDVQMPEMGGIEAAQALRDKGSPIPIVMFSADITAADRKKSLNFGNMAWLPKPYECREIANTLLQFKKP